MLADQILTLVHFENGGRIGREGGLEGQDVDDGQFGSQFGSDVACCRKSLQRPFAEVSRTKNSFDFIHGASYLSCVTLSQESFCWPSTLSKFDTSGDLHPGYAWMPRAGHTFTFLGGRAVEEDCASRTPRQPALVSSNRHAVSASDVHHPSCRRSCRWYWWSAASWVCSHHSYPKACACSRLLPGAL